MDDIFWREDPLPVASSPQAPVRRQRAKPIEVDDTHPSAPVRSKASTALFGHSIKWHAKRFEQ